MQSGEGGVGSGEGGVKSSEVVTFGREQCSSSGFVRPVHQEVPKLNEVPLDIICTGKCTMALTPTAMSTHTHIAHMRIAHCYYISHTHIHTPTHIANAHNHTDYTHTHECTVHTAQGHASSPASKSGGSPPMNTFRE